MGPKIGKMDIITKLPLKYRFWDIITASGSFPGFGTQSACALLLKLFYYLKHGQIDFTLLLYNSKIFSV
jgi:hypothetical protein